MLCAEDAFAALVKAAGEAGVEVDVGEARAWLAGVEAALATPGEFVVSAAGIGGDELALLDFDPGTVERLRRLGRLIAAPPVVGVRSALAISGSAAQGRIQLFPADVDFFERVHIAAATREEAGRRLAAAIRANALAVAENNGLRLREVHFGRGPGGALRWTAAEVAAGRRTVATGDGAIALDWDDAARDPGFIKLDWRVGALGGVGPGKVSKVVDATWEGPDGRVESLDGALDAEFQQVYLEAEGAALVLGLQAVVPSAEQRAAYVQAIEGEVRRFAAASPPVYGKVAKRLYNLCRLTGRYAEAVYLRELFDEPPARLHQARSELQLLAAGCDADVPGTCAALRSLVDDVLTAVGGDEACGRAAMRCRELPDEADIDAVRAAMTALGRARGGSEPGV